MNLTPRPPNAHAEHQGIDRFRRGEVLDIEAGEAAYAPRYAPDSAVWPWIAAAMGSGEPILRNYLQCWPGPTFAAKCQQKV
jgi:hypothetical protein